MPFLPENQVPENKLSFGDDSEQKQSRQMFIALTLLLAALIVVLTKDRDFWFPSAPGVQSESGSLEESSPEPKAQSANPTTTTQPTVPAQLKTRSHSSRAAGDARPNPVAASAPVVSSRAVLPPLEVEVVAGDEHRTVPAGNNSVKVDLQTPSTPVQESSALVTTDPVRGTEFHLPPGAAQILSRPLEPNYPLLAKQMKIQGAVVLEVLIGRDGNIQHLHVISGPAILSAAAREAVKQWRFRPYLKSGQPVETEARITVNFTIFTQ